jgi:hypothetical protein
MQRPDSIPLLGIGMAVGGVDAGNRDVYEAISAFQTLVMDQRQGFDDAGVHLNLNFEIGGPLFAPEPKGLRLSRFDHKSGWAIVICTVPSRLEAAAVGEFLVGVLTESLDKVRRAANRSVRRGAAWETANLERLVEHLTAIYAVDAT